MHQINTTAITTLLIINTLADLGIEGARAVDADGNSTHFWVDFDAHTGCQIWVWPDRGYTDIEPYYPDYDDAPSADAWNAMRDRALAISDALARRLDLDDCVLIPEVVVFRTILEPLGFQYNQTYNGSPAWLTREGSYLYADGAIGVFTPEMADVWERIPIADVRAIADSDTLTCGCDDRPNTTWPIAIRDPRYAHHEVRPPYRPDWWRVEGPGKDGYWAHFHYLNFSGMERVVRTIWCAHDGR